MKGLIWNIIGVFLVIVFVQSVDWPLWASIPLGIVFMAVVVIFSSYLVTKISNYIRYGER